jgi:arginine exporter protein ArgO
MDAFVTGVVAGYGIAIPVGAIAILIIDLGMRRGFRPAFAAGAGAATADLFYSGLAFVGGAALAGAIASVEGPLRILSGVVLIAIALVGLYRARRPQTATTPSDTAGDAALGRTYGRFLALTIINPATVAYFAAVVIGLGIVSDMALADGLLFISGAFLASLSWQTLLAGLGSLAGVKLTSRTTTLISVGGNLLILGFGMAILLR